MIEKCVMKLHFENNLEYQLMAVDAVTDLFQGQDICHAEFTISSQLHEVSQTLLGFTKSQLGIGNYLRLSDDQLLQNLNEIQFRNGIRPSKSLESRNFTVEMETGTGKTYVYLRTIFELNKRYGFTKFVIVVPSIAIKEGVYKSLHITRVHFESLYPNAKGYEYFLYDSSKLGQVRNFASSSNIQVMVITVGAINKKDVNNLYKVNEKTGDEIPIDLVRATHPIVIVDEPQSVDGGLSGKGREALEAMKPICTLRYSATHIDRYHMLYRLDAVDAYERGLVKQIEVASLEVKGGYNNPYVKLISTHAKKGSPIAAKVEVDLIRSGKVRREVMTVEDGDDLEQETGRSIYKNFRIGTILCSRERQSMAISIPGEEYVLRPEEEIGGVNSDDLKRLMIHRSIKEHLDKEMLFAKQGHAIKVLTLFFVDRVNFYRSYDDDGNPIKGKYAQMFEDEYRKLAKCSDYQDLFANINLEFDAEEVHNGYFSIDKNRRFHEPSRKGSGQIGDNKTNRDNAERAYNLIMKEKEKLLSFESKLKFIFSHSALKEGWDNPNVFQICALRDMGSELERRQTIGRGLRLCVDQNGRRLHDSNLNTLTVVATESFEQFAKNLQTEIEKDTGIRFGIVEMDQFSTLVVTNENGTTEPLGVDKSELIWKFLLDRKYIDSYGRIQNSLRTALKEDSLELPRIFFEQEEAIKLLLRKLAGKVNIKNANERVTVRIRRAVLESKEFQALWERIKYKTTYRVEFDNLKLIEKCKQSIFDAPTIVRARAQFRSANISIDRSGVIATEHSTSGFEKINENDFELPDILTDLQEKTQLTRRSLVKILTECRRLNDFKKNPQEFIEIVAEAINRSKRLAIVDGIRYKRTGDNHYYTQELFEQKELFGYLKNTLKSQKSVYEYVVYDSIGVERRFAEELEANEVVKVYAKLPAWFKIPTSLGTYNPDWAVLVEKDSHEKLYFVVETKSSSWLDDLRHVESAKIKCGKKHFSALVERKNPARYIQVTNVDDMLRYTE